MALPLEETEAGERCSKDENILYCISLHIWLLLFSLPKVMDSDGELNHLRLQFQALQQQQEKRKLDRKKEREANKVVTQDYLDVSQPDISIDR